MNSFVSLFQILAISNVFQKHPNLFLMLLFYLFDIMVKLEIEDVRVMGSHKNFMRWINFRLLNRDIKLFKYLHSNFKHVHFVHHVLVLIFCDVIIVNRLIPILCQMPNLLVHFPLCLIEDAYVHFLDVITAQLITRKWKLEVRAILSCHLIC